MREIVITSSDRLIDLDLLGDAQWAEVRHGDCIPIFGQVLIADLFRLGAAACAIHSRPERALGPLKWVLYRTDGRWYAYGPLVGLGCKWWSDEVTYREEPNAALSA